MEVYLKLEEADYFLKKLNSLKRNISGGTDQGKIREEFRDRKSVV
jgi:hypothetical protein